MGSYRALPGRVPASFWYSFRGARVTLPASRGRSQRRGASSVTPYGSDDGTYLLPGQTARTLRVPDPPGTEGRRESDTLLEVEEGRL